MHLLAPQFTPAGWLGDPDALITLPALWESAAWCPRPPAELKMERCPARLLSEPEKKGALGGP